VPARTPLIGTQPQAPVDSHLIAGMCGVLSWYPDSKKSGSPEAARKGFQHPLVLLPKTQADQSGPLSGTLAISETMQSAIHPGDRLVGAALRLAAIMLCAGFWIGAVALLI